MEKESIDLIWMTKKSAFLWQTCSTTSGRQKRCFLGHFLLTFQPFSVIIVFIEKPNKELEIYVSNIIIRGQKPMSIIKKEAKKLIDKLPEQATWDDIMYEFYVKKKLAVALKAADEGRVIPHKEVKKRLLSKWKSNGLNRPFWI